mgnify:CR=1 FL=1
MPFFDSVDEDATVEGHAKAVQKLQKSQAQALIDDYKAARLDLIDRLSRAPYSSFTAQQLRGVLAQVNVSIAVMSDSIKGNMRQGSIESAMKGVEHLQTEIRKFSSKFTGAVVPINLNAVKVASDTSNFLFNNYETSMQKYDADVRARIARGLTQAAIEQLPYEQIVAKVGKFFQGTEWELQRVVRTELHHTYALGKFNAMKEVRREVLPDLKKALYHPMDSRTGQDSIELAERNPILPMDKPFVQNYRATPKSKVQRFVFMVPPNRPNDRAILIPYRDAWGA